MKIAISRIGFLLSACALTMLAGCAVDPQAISGAEQQQMLNALVQGRARLSCATVGCAGEYGYNSQSLRLRQVAGAWQALALQVMKIDYLNDAGYYYLGQAAEGFNAPHAALVYYNTAVNIARSARGSCTARGLCDGINLPRDAQFRIQQITLAIERQRIDALQARQREQELLQQQMNRQSPVRQPARSRTSPATPQWKVPSDDEIIGY